MEVQKGVILIVEVYCVKPPKKRNMGTCCLVVLHIVHLGKVLSLGFQAGNGHSEERCWKWVCHLNSTYKGHFGNVSPTCTFHLSLFPLSLVLLFSSPEYWVHVPGNFKYIPKINYFPLNMLTLPSVAGRFQIHYRLLQELTNSRHSLNICILDNTKVASLWLYSITDFVKASCTSLAPYGHAETRQ